MKKIVSVAFALLALLALAAPGAARAADCATAPMSSAVAVDELAGDGAQVELDDLLEVGPAESAEQADGFPEICWYDACQLTPTGCGCAGFYCNGEFICGIKRKFV